MKVRSDFVSNSSSSSFVVISDRGKYHNGFGGDFIQLPCRDYGCYSFGWQTEKYYDIYSKLNWCAIIVNEILKSDEESSSQEKLEKEVKQPWKVGEAMKALLLMVCKDKLDLDVELVPNNDPSGDYDDAYIDHESDAFRSPENMRMFEDEKKLYDFIANENSYIDNSNDNGGRDDEWDSEIGGYPPQPKDYEI